MYPFRISDRVRSELLLYRPNQSALFPVVAFSYKTRKIISVMGIN